MHTRRSILAILASGVATVDAGCAGSASGETGTRLRSSRTTGTDMTSGTPESSTPTVEPLGPGETAASEDGTAATLSAVRLRRIVYTIDEGTSVRPYPAGETGSQFLVADVATAADRPASSLALAVTLDGAAATDRAYRLGDPGESHGSLAFSIPVAAVERGAIEWRPSREERFRWQTPSSVVADVDRAPRFEVRRFDVPGTIERGGPLRATLEVANTGDRDGRFLGEVYDRGASSLPLVGRFAFEVPAGESTTEQLTGRAVSGDRSSATAILDWGVDRREASFSIA